LPAERRHLQQLSDRSGNVENLRLQRRRQGVPLHDYGSAKTAQNVLFLVGKGRAAGSVLQLFKLAAFVWTGRTLEQFTVLGCFARYCRDLNMPSSFIGSPWRVPINIRA
jgi:hypothetical protein